MKCNNTELFALERQMMNYRCLLDIKRPVCDFATAMVNKSQLQAAKCWRADFIFDTCDFHKLLVLEKTHFKLKKTISKHEALGFLPTI